jgi:hypothetical protein
MTLRDSIIDVPSVAVLTTGNTAGNEMAQGETREPSSDKLTSLNDYATAIGSDTNNATPHRHRAGSSILRRPLCIIFRRVGLSWSLEARSEEECVADVEQIPS